MLFRSEYELKLKGTDSFGNPVSFEGAGFGPENELRFEPVFLVTMKKAM